MELSLILEGGISATVKKNIGVGQMSLLTDENNEILGFGTDGSELANEVQAQINGLGVVNLEQIRGLYPRLQIADDIAKQQRFMHWELEFADLFYERGGFDLVIGNPPWILLGWNETGLLSEHQPLLAIKKMSATKVASLRKDILSDENCLKAYENEYTFIAGEQNYLNAISNYKELVGMKANLYKCFLPLSWRINTEEGVSAFVHPDGVFEDPKGGELRRRAYARLRKHFMFANELKLFHEVHHHTQFSLNVYGGPQEPNFDMITYLYDPKTIVECEDGDCGEKIPGIKDEDGNWNTKGHPSRLVNVGEKELRLFALLFDGSDKWETAKLPTIIAKEQIEVLSVFGKFGKRLKDYESNLYTTTMWNETNAKDDGTLLDEIRFPDDIRESLFVGATCGMANPLFQTVRREYNVNSDYDTIDLSQIDDWYLPRSKYVPGCSIEEYISRIPETPWGQKCNSDYMLVNREFVGTTSERTLVVCMLPPKACYLYTLFGIVKEGDSPFLAKMGGYECSIVFDFFIKVLGKNHINYGVNMQLPVISSEFDRLIVLRFAMLNCLNAYYAKLWKDLWNDRNKDDSYAKMDARLDSSIFERLDSDWKWEFAARTDYLRRHLLVEIDVLVSMAMGLSLEELKAIYELQFPVLMSNESDTWYDRNGRIVFTSNRSLTNIGFSRKEWEEIKDAKEGIFARTITDDTMPGGPVVRTIEYVAPFDRCDREKDYEEVWHNFEERFKRC